MDCTGRILPILIESINQKQIDSLAIQEHQCDKKLCSPTTNQKNNTRHAKTTQKHYAPVQQWQKVVEIWWHSTNHT